MFFAKNKRLPSYRLDYIIELMNSAEKNKNNLKGNYSPKDYIETAVSDYTKTIKSAFEMSRPTYDNRYPKDKLCPRIINDNIFCASTEKKEDGNVHLNISLGALFALDDIFFRMVSCEDFFSCDPKKGSARQWKGSDCLWFHLVGTHFPQYRFYDYNHTERKAKESKKGTFLSGFYEAIPFDKERSQIAVLMIKVATVWILMHEEGHYAGGHLNYLKAKKRMSALDEINAFEKIIELKEQYKIFEWQADRTATAAVFDIFFQDPYLDVIPSYCGPNTFSNKVTWMFRLLLTTIGTVIQIINKARLIQEENNPKNNNKSKDIYPSTRTRLISSARTALGNFRVEEVNNALKTKEDTFSFFIPAVCGSFDDLNVVAKLINRDGHVESWALGESPKIEETRSHDLMGSIEEAELLTQLIELSALPKESLDKVFLDPKLGKHKRMYGQWFSELNYLVSNFDLHVSPFMEKYRHEVGHFV